jgi:dihydroflavonol-4-reductase
MSPNDCATGDDVVALVRSLATAGALRELGCELVQGQLTDGDAVGAGVSGCDGIVHIAAAYKLGVTHDECRDTQRSNVGGTETIFEAGVDAGIDRILYVSTINYFGNIFGRVLNEGDERPSMDFLSCYDETKYRAHLLALEFIGRGGPIVITQPGSVYGPRDHSQRARLFAAQPRRGTASDAQRVHMKARSEAVPPA